MFGKVTFISDLKDCGYLVENGTGQEFFFHRNNVDPRLPFADLRGERVDFDRRQGERQGNQKPAAVNIRPVKWPK